MTTTGLDWAAIDRAATAAQREREAQVRDRLFRAAQHLGAAVEAERHPPPGDAAPRVIAPARRPDLAQRLRACAERLRSDSTEVGADVAAELDEVAAALTGSEAWSGLCPAGLHGLDREGQACDLCAWIADGQVPAEVQQRARALWSPPALPSVAVEARCYPATSRRPAGVALTLSCAAGPEAEARLRAAAHRVAAALIELGHGGAVLTGAGHGADGCAAYGVSVPVGQPLSRGGSAPSAVESIAAGLVDAARAAVGARP